MYAYFLDLLDHSWFHLWVVCCLRLMFPLFRAYPFYFVASRLNTMTLMRGLWIAYHIPSALSYIMSFWWLWVVGGLSCVSYHGCLCKGADHVGLCKGADHVGLCKGVISCLCKGVERFVHVNILAWLPHRRFYIDMILGDFVLIYAYFLA